MQPHGLQPPRLLHPWDFPGNSTGVGCHCLLPSVRLRRTKWRTGLYFFPKHTWGEGSFLLSSSAIVLQLLYSKRCYFLYNVFSYYLRSYLLRVYNQGNTPPESRSASAFPLRAQVTAFMKELKNKYKLTATKDGDLASIFVCLHFFLCKYFEQTCLWFSLQKSRNKLRKRRNGKENGERSGEATCIKGGRRMRTDNYPKLYLFSS